MVSDDDLQRYAEEAFARGEPGLERAADGRIIDARGMDDEMRLDYGLRPRQEPIELVNDNERLAWLAAFGSGVVVQGFSRAIASANQAVSWLRALEPECEVVELPPDEYREMLKSSAGRFDASGRKELCPAVYKGRRGCETREIQEDGTIKRTFYRVKEEGA